MNEYEYWIVLFGPSYSNSSNSLQIVEQLQIICNIWNKNMFI